MAADFSDPRELVHQRIDGGVAVKGVATPRLGEIAVIAKGSAENPLFAKVIESQKAWARRVIYWYTDIQVDQKAAYAHYFGKGPLAA